MRIEHDHAMSVGRCGHHIEAVMTSAFNVKSQKAKWHKLPVSRVDLTDIHALRTEHVKAIFIEAPMQLTLSNMDMYRR
ncbi:hypothetical protein AX760_13640 [Pararhizobium antarcticum]|uniref:Uncharacterized protein n=1 Tax=Pararhizobium antarcticum TaxID=1798805 RepID=A0A657LWR4_9HYPH|nr:hypothetical protein AX761_23175 [Rhizobium sp. 58]OJF99250.1 hypothetical protein AX760_13640 [Pararhizobium antarcticum]